MTEGWTRTRRFALHTFEILREVTWYIIVDIESGGVEFVDDGLRSPMVWSMVWSMLWSVLVQWWHGIQGIWHYPHRATAEGTTGRCRRDVTGQGGQQDKGEVVSHGGDCSVL